MYQEKCFKPDMKLKTNDSKDTQPTSLTKKVYRKND